MSMKVLMDCCLENGAIVAANAIKNYYPATAGCYFYVWPRDASYVCIAADLMGICDIQEAFFKWCLERAEGFSQTGLFFEKYYVNGLKASRRFQPDQTATVLFAIWHHYQDDLKSSLIFKDLITKAADGLCTRWEIDHFDIVTTDLWEERLTFPDLEDNFTYSLAACIRGLECANALIVNNKWQKVSRQMREQLEKHVVNGYFVRSYGKLKDERIDASLLGLVYPFGIYKADDPKVILSVREIEKKLVIDGGVHRYEFDEYDGWIYEEIHRKKGAGAWPLLNFWLSIYYSLKGDGDHAVECYNWVLDKVNGYIPEQIFDNELQVSICPLAWSHAMFIIASKLLGYI
ncbi:MAG: glycoside hydrolase family 15 protein [Methanothrix sp.]|nr:glycoside hydrolase family 15 protein [Methanothrix sp.]